MSGPLANAVLCKYKCGTMIQYHYGKHEWMEQATGLVHDYETRCKKIRAGEIPVPVVQQQAPPQQPTSTQNPTPPAGQITGVEEWLLKELVSLQESARVVCKKLLGSEFDNASSERQIMMLMHYENVILDLMKLREGKK